MRPSALWIIVVALAGCGASKSETLQRHVLNDAIPADLEVASPWDKDPRIIKVRVWVDEDFRAQNMRWKAQIEGQVDEANQFLMPALGLQLEIAAFEQWELRSRDLPVEEVLASLETKDPGADVGFVIGYISSLALVSNSFEKLGCARVLGKHLVVRGYADVREREQFARVFPLIGEAEREAVHQSRRRHKQAVLLLHEVFHTLGGLHESDKRFILNSGYDVDMSRISDRSRELMQLVIEERAKPIGEQDQAALAGRLAEFLDANPWGGVMDADLDQLKTMLAGMQARSGGGKPARDIPVPAAVYDQFVHARELAHEGKIAEALVELEAMVEAYPGTAEIRQAICEVHIFATGPDSAEAIKACDRAAEVSPDDPRPLMTRAKELLRAGKRTEALELLPRVEARAGERSSVWDDIAGVYQAATAVTQAEAAAARSAAIAPPVSGVHPVAEWAARTRARYGLPPDAKRWKIAPADEADYVATVRELLDLVYAGKHEDAAARARAAEKKWKGAPGILAARCDLELRLKDKAAAKKLCAQAVKAWGGAAWALYLQGVIDLNEKQDKRGIASLRAAIAADPDLGQAYRALGKALVRVKDSDGRDALDEEYRKRFGQGLPE